MGPAEIFAEEPNGNSLVLPSLMDLTAAEALCRSLLDCLPALDSIVIEGGDVERVSTAALQVLLAAAEDARTRGIPFRLNRSSAALTDALTDLGLSL